MLQPQKAGKDVLSQLASSPILQNYTPFKASKSYEWMRENERERRKVGEYVGGWVGVYK